VRSGVTGSKLCVARYPQFTLAVGHDASDPRLSGNHIRQCSPGELTVEPGPRTVEFGERLQLRGLFLGQLPGSRVVAQARERGARRFVRADATHSKRNGRFKLNLRPRIGEVVRLRSGSAHGPAFHVGVRPRVVLRHRGSLVAKVRAGRSYAGRTVVLQLRRHGHWVAVQHLELGRHSRARFRPGVHGVVRIAVARTPGYLPAHSEPVRLP
jgi:hypothetical protein